MVAVLSIAVTRKKLDKLDEKKVRAHGDMVKMKKERSTYKHTHPHPQTFNAWGRRAGIFLEVEKYLQTIRRRILTFYKRKEVSCIAVKKHRQIYAILKKF